MEGTGRFNSVYIKMIIAFIMLNLVSVIGCNLPGVAAEATVTMNITQAYQTIGVRLTELDQLTGTIPVSKTTTPTNGEAAPTALTTITYTPDMSEKTSTVEIMCDQAAAGQPIDITIPDDSEMLPEQTFTKIWRIINVGTCTWTNQYGVVFFSGEQMGASSFIPLTENIAPGQSVDIAVEMKAPKKAGSFQSNWKLRNANNQTFGIGPDGSAPFWVRIIVVSTINETPPSGQAATTITSTPTPRIKVSGSTSLILDDKLDLDNNQVNPGRDEDLSDEESNKLTLDIFTWSLP